MHELGLTEGLLKVVLRHAEGCGASRVISVTLRIGELSDIAEPWLQKYFDYLSRNTVAAGAKINVIRTPVRFRCGACEGEFNTCLKECRDVVCPSCGSSRLTIQTGREFIVQEMEVC